MLGNRDLLQQLLPEQPDLDAQDLQVSQVSSEQKKIMYTQFPIPDLI